MRVFRPAAIGIGLPSVTASYQSRSTADCIALIGWKLRSLSAGRIYCGPQAPFYRFLLRIRLFFIAESQAHLAQITGQLTALERQLAALESHQRAQWIAFEQLYLCFLNDPDRNTRSQLQQFLEAERAKQMQE
jgi:hypothetical protein